MNTTIADTGHASKKMATIPPPSRPPFFGSTLKQVLKFVLPEDLASVSMVCKTWRDELKKPTATTSSSKEHEHAPSAPGVVNNSTAMWKQAVINSSPCVMQAVIAATTKHSGDVEEQAAAAAEIDFLALAKSGLGRNRKKLDPPVPVFRIQDLLVVLELKQKKVIIDQVTGEPKALVKSLGAFVQNGSDSMLQKNHCGNVDFDLTNAGPDLVLEGQNLLCLAAHNGNVALWEDAKAQFKTRLEEEVTNRSRGRVKLWHRLKLPFETAGEEAFSNFRVSVTLIRRDDWRSFILVDDFKIYGVQHENGRLLLQSCCLWDYDCSPFARSERGTVAREVLESSKVDSMGAALLIKFGCGLPPPDTSEEPSWLRKCRGPRLSAWTDQDFDEISKVQSFSFRLEALSLNLAKCMVDDDISWRADGEFEDPNGFLLLLEGLDWQLTFCSMKLLRIASTGKHVSPTHAEPRLC